MNTEEAVEESRFIFKSILAGTIVGLFMGVIICILQQPDKDPFIRISQIRQECLINENK